MSQTQFRPGFIFVITAVLVVFFIYSTTSNSRSSRSNQPANFVTDQVSIFTARGFISYEEADKNIFRPMGLQTIETTLIPKLQYIEQPTCKDIYASWLVKSNDYDESAAPPREIPNNWEKNYTLGGYGHLVKGYMDDRSGVKSSRWDMVEEWMTKDLEFFAQRGENYYNGGVAMYEAMKHYPLNGKVGVVIGSLTPWVESFALRNGAEQVTTVEYMKIEVIGTDKVKYKHPVEMAKEASNYFSAYDFAASFSSMEHSGLGRYGDVPDPIGDIREMLKVRCLLKEQGLFFFGVPAGPDCLHWNLHRIYGRLRLAIMFAGFDLIDSFYDASPSNVVLRSSMFGKEASLCSGLTQRVFVLRKNAD